MPVAKTYPSGLSKWGDDDKPQWTTDVTRDNGIIDAFIQAHGSEAYTLTPSAWTQQPGGEYHYTLTGDPFFATNGYLYQLAPDPAEALSVAALGGIYLRSIPAEGSVVLLCPKQPTEDIHVTITRQPLAAEEGGE